tara:strand:+ start:85 stop:363 length:279 start_codon:yes stop_codon:yes gene_type:complete
MLGQRSNEQNLAAHINGDSRTDKGRDLIKQVRKQLLEIRRPMLESLVHEVAGVKVRSMHHDISTATGEEVVVFSLENTPRFEPAGCVESPIV